LIFRLNDYFFYQFLNALTDANPYQDIIERLKVEIDPFNRDINNKVDMSKIESQEDGTRNYGGKLIEASLIGGESN
jgi:hypothetical protein